MIGDIKKFNFGELTSNSNGKTSATGVSGLMCITVGLLGFIFSILGAAYYSMSAEHVYASIIVITIGAGLLGYKKKVSKDIISNFKNTE